MASTHKTRQVRFSKALRINLEPVMVQRLDELSKDRGGIPLSVLCREAIKRYLDEQGMH